MANVLDELESLAAGAEEKHAQQLPSVVRAGCTSSGAPTALRGEEDVVGKVEETPAVAFSASSGFYAANLPLQTVLPELAEHFLPMEELVLGRYGPAFGQPPVPGTPVLYLGAGRQRTPLHFDPTENLTAMLQGSKRFRLFPPAASLQLQPRGGALAAFICWLRGVVPAVYSDIDVWGLSPLELPRFVDVVLDPGEVLYLPAAWWHAVEGSPEPNASLVFGFAPLV